MAHYITSKDRRWKKGILPFEASKKIREMDRDSNGNSVIGQVIAEYKLKTNVNIVPRIASQHSSYVKLIASTRLAPGFCNSKIGRRGGRQLIKCAIGGLRLNFDTLVHEFGHALGLKHEHQRWDRDSFVIVNLILAGVRGRLGDYKKINPIHHTMSGPYDLASAMHYSRNRGSQTQIMVRRDSRGTNGMGGGPGLSDGDVAALNKIYPGRIKIRR